MEGVSVDAPPPNTSAASSRIYEDLSDRLNKVRSTNHVTLVTHSYNLLWEKHKITHYSDIYYTYSNGSISVKHDKGEEMQIIDLKA